MLVIGLTGLAGSGKSTLANYLKKYGFEFFVFSDILKNEAKKRGMLSGKSYEEQKTVFSMLGDKLRAESKNKGILADMLVKEINSRDLDKAVIDGFRSTEEVEAFKDNFRNFHLILLDANFDVRFKRRCIEDPNANEQIFFNRDKADMENKGMKKVLSMADFRIDNNGRIDNLKNQADIILRKIM